MIAPRTALVLLALLACGCVSIVSVEKSSTASQAGVSFNLPEVFLQVVKKADGTYEIRKHFIPDPAQEYVVNTTSVFGNYTIDIKRGANNLLESVSFDADTTALAKQAIESATAVHVARVGAAAARAQADAEDARIAGEKATAALDAAEKAETDAKVALDVAQEKERLLAQRGGDAAPRAGADARLQAELALAEAKVRFKAAADHHASLRSRYKAPARAGDPSIPPGVIQLYRVKMTKDAVHLQEVGAPKP